MPNVHVRTIFGSGYTVDQKAFTLVESDSADAPGGVTGVRLSEADQNIFIPMTNIDRIIWKTE